jgi:hypothetical protein
METYEYKDLVDFRIKLGTVVATKLCEIIVAHRYLGIMKDEAILCMQELARRRGLGDDFQFEEYIKALQEKLPKLKLDVEKIMKDPFKGVKKLKMPGLFR